MRKAESHKEAGVELGKSQSECGGVSGGRRGTVGAGVEQKGEGSVCYFIIIKQWYISTDKAHPASV